MVKNKLMDLIRKYEDNNMNAVEVFTLFATLIGSGIIWQLNQNYQKTAINLIEEGYLTADGKMNYDRISRVTGCDDCKSVDPDNCGPCYKMEV